jgi:hypothetical protein
MQTGYLQLLARNQNGTVSSVLNEIGSFKKEFSVSDITTSIVTDVTGTNANLKFTITTAFGDVASTNYIFFSARTMGDKAIYIPAP